MHGNRCAPVAAVAVLAGALAVTACASTSAKTNGDGATATGGSSVVTASTALGAAAGNTHIIVYSINSDGPHLRAVLTGAVGDYGPAVTIFPDGKVDPDHTSEMELRLTHGSFRLAIGGFEKKIVSAFAHWRYDTTTCSGEVRVTGTVPVVAGSGTGSYRGARGGFDLTATIDEVDRKPCSAGAAFLWQVIVMAGSGTVSS